MWRYVMLDGYNIYRCDLGTCNARPSSHCSIPKNIRNSIDREVFGKVVICKYSTDKQEPRNYIEIMEPAGRGGLGPTIATIPKPNGSKVCAVSVMDRQKYERYHGGI